MVCTWTILYVHFILCSFVTGAGVNYNPIRESRAGPYGFTIHFRGQQVLIQI